jgi:hypothetical protein
MPTVCTCASTEVGYDPDDHTPPQPIPIKNPKLTFLKSGVSSPKCVFQVCFGECQVCVPGKCVLVDVNDLQRATIKRAYKRREEPTMAPTRQ